MLLAHNYAVLVPDSRGHGSSDGDLITFGVKEADDTRRWVEWLAETTHPRKIYGLGESMGAANLLQSLPIEPQLRAVVAEAPFANLPRIAYDRLGMFLRIGPRWRRPLFWPVIDTAVLYGRFRYGIWLPDASPERAVARSSTPVLLIRDGRDDRMPSWHIDALLAANPGLALWDVPEAIHTGAFGAEPEEFARRVTGWFETH